MLCFKLVYFISLHSFILFLVIKYGQQIEYTHSFAVFLFVNVLFTYLFKICYGTNYILDTLGIVLVL